MVKRIQLLHFCAAASLIALIFLCLGWELRWAPLRPGGSLLALKAVTLLLPLFGILRGKRYTCQWASMFMLLYLMEGLVRATSEHGISRNLAAAETVLALLFIASAVGYSRLVRNAPRRQSATTAG
jgi:uncharacterized membrane protein